MTTESQKLLSAYVKSGSEDAFRELLRQYVDLVYSTALRVAHGDEHLAQDVTQTVFLNLARKAATIPDSMPLGGWLHRDAFFTASKMVRAEIRRESRERKAVEMNLLHASEQSTIETSLHLDAAINQLPDHDRQAILLRFFEQRDFESIGQALGSSANAAQKRVSRAVDQLRRILSGRGVIVSEVALLATLGQVVSAAPPALAGTVGVAVLSAIKTPTLNLLAILMGNKIFTAVTGIVIAGSLFAPLLLQTHRDAIIQDQQSALDAQQEEIASLATSIQELSSAKLARSVSQNHANPAFLELMKLRGSVGLLRQEVNNLAKPENISRDLKLAALAQQSAARMAALKAHLAHNPSESIPEFEYLTDADWLWLAGERFDFDEEGLALAMSLARLTAEGNVSRDILRPALLKFAQANGGQFPRTLSDLEPFLSSPISTAILNRWQIVPAKHLTGLAANLSKEDWVITQVAPVNPAFDQRIVFSLRDYHMFASDRPEHWAVQN